MKFANIILYFLLWLTVCTAIHFLLPRGYVVFPLVLGLAFWFYLNRDKPTPRGPLTLALLLLTASSLLSCQRTPAPAAIELRTAQEGDTIRWATQSYEDARGYTHTIPAGRAW